MTLFLFAFQLHQPIQSSVRKKAKKPCMLPLLLETIPFEYGALTPIHVYLSSCVFHYYLH